MRLVRVSAPGKLILIGEHAAPYGCPAVTSALELRCTVSVTPCASGNIELILPTLHWRKTYASSEVLAYSREMRARWQRYDQRPTPDTTLALHSGDADHLVKCAIGETLAALSVPSPGFRLSVTGDIPLNAGFGSSAALATATVAALLSYFRHPLTAERVLFLAGESEKRQHGAPSGIDHHTAYYGGMLKMTHRQRGELLVTPLPQASLHLQTLRIFHSGIAAETTGNMVAAVRRLMCDPQRSPLPVMQGLAEEMLALLTRQSPVPDQLMKLLRAYQAKLELLGVVPPAVQRVIRAVEAAGGAAKISGAGALSGSGAGCVMAYCPYGVPDALVRWPEIRSGLAADGLRVEEDNG